MAYQVEFRPEALDDIGRTEKAIGQRIMNKLKWLSENFEEITPQPLAGELRGLFKLRVGDYRIIYSVNSEQSLIVVHLVGHRREIYR